MDTAFIWFDNKLGKIIIRRNIKDNPASLHEMFHDSTENTINFRMGTKYDQLFTQDYLLEMCFMCNKRIFHNYFYKLLKSRVIKRESNQSNKHWNVRSRLYVVLRMTHHGFFQTVAN